HLAGPVVGPHRLVAGAVDLLGEVAGQVPFLAGADRAGRVGPARLARLPAQPVVAVQRHVTVPVGLPHQVAVGVIAPAERLAGAGGPRGVDRLAGQVAQGGGSRKAPRTPGGPPGAPPARRCRRRPARSPPRPSPPPWSATSAAPPRRSWRP